MRYCSNCGKSLEEGVKFCPYCGTKVVENLNNSIKPILKKQKMEKGVVKRLSNETILNTKPKPEYVANEPIKESAVIRDKTKQESEKLDEKLKDTIGTHSLPSTTIGVYFILNFILMMGNSNSDEIMGIFIYTWIVLFIIFIRKNKEKPFNWLLNIFVSLQAILVFATIMMTLEYLDGGGDSIDVVIQLGLLILLLITIVTLLYKGNRRSS